MCGRRHAGSLLEDRSSDPPPQVLPPLDDLRRTVPAMVERRCSASATVDRNDQDRQRKLPPDRVLAVSSHGTGLFGCYESINHAISLLVTC